MTCDRGLQPARTRLAWRRTALAVTAVAILAARLALALGTTGAPLAVAGLLGALVFGAVAYRRGQAIGRARPGPRGSPMVLSALATLGYAVLGILVVLASLV